ncbi:acetyl-CoA C-acetyltransferase [Leucobacter rhizosphaerae]|uniref:acetyl-CoA C-acyltransferase n=1 Tax=Leucobacter rhizosphaerae TaxID=2932245 RepID=A0ABY4G095_9MICO|nr:acetyl-CoA C-acetyltransferase [Leucobacter rhizosphaerae]UOQ61930.1 acetyl-CoA C-acetyltransferase [Leucobacter rhizosphaerae]
MRDAVIVATSRSPIGRAVKGSLRDVRPDDLLAHTVGSVLERIPGLEAREIEDIIIGCGSPAAQQGFNIARVVAVLRGLDSVPGTTVNRYCASSVQSIRMAAHAVVAGEGDVFVAGGVESISAYRFGDADVFPDAENPEFLSGAGGDEGVGNQNSRWTDPRSRGALPDVYLSMGQTAENVASLAGISRREMDEYALESQRRTAAADHRGFWSAEIDPFTLPDGTEIAADDSPRPSTTLDALESLQPVFREGGTVTAGNACPLNDGASAVVVMSAEKARRLGVRPLARIVSTAVSALSPEIMGLGPVEATARALSRAGMSIGDIDQVELNEAFAAQVIASARAIGVDDDRLNVNGGAIALGHPFGSTGARITTTLLHSLEERDEELGLVTMCVAGGQGAAMILQRLN